MATVGLIANPAAGRDIRRLVAHASIFDNNDKVNIIRRVLLGLDAVGVDDVVIMPDSVGLGARALEQLSLSSRVRLLDLTVSNTAADSTRAAELMRLAGVDCIVTLGGDGTNRAVARGSGPVPLLPISAGTNNVFPIMIEGTIAGVTAGLVARGIVDVDRICRPSSRLDILDDSSVCDIALIDAVVCAEPFVGARAVWSETRIHQIILTRADPTALGFSAIGGNLGVAGLGPHQGLSIDVGDGPVQVLAPIAPGVLRRVGVTAWRVLEPGDEVAIAEVPGVLALDGEREVEVRARQDVRVRLSPAGPRVIDVQAALHEAATQGFFVRASELEGG